MASKNAPLEPAEQAIKDAKGMLHQLFEVMGIERIFIIDDELSTALDLPDIFGEVKSKLASGEVDSILRVDALKGLTLSAPVEIWKKQLDAIWAKMEPAEREALATELGVVTEASEEATGRGVLGQLLGDYKLTFLTLQQWKDSRDQIVRDATIHPSLFLFDQDMRKNAGGTETEGMKLIAGLLKGQPAEPPMYCGLFTNMVTADTEHERHTAYATDFELEAERNRFAVISKEHLHEQPSALAVRLKRVAISPWCEKLKIQLVNAVKDAVDDAASKVEHLDIYDFEQIVFQSSYKEGVWEADTLLRVFGLFHREATRTRAINDSVLVSAADKVRSVISLPYRPADRKGTQAFEITRLDLYEQSAYLNSHRIPIDVGDIFQKTGGKRQYILLEQPCDLMVRGNTGKRNADSVILVEMVEQGKDDDVRDSLVELEYYSADETRKCFVDMSNCVTVPAFIIDLCVFSSEGIAEIKVGDPCPTGMIHSWKLRYDIVQKEAASIVKRFKEYTSTGNAGSAAAVKTILEATLTGSVSGVLKGEIKANPDRIVYNLKRVARVKQPRSGSLLRELAYFKARDAFDHDLMRTLEHDACKSAETCR